MKIFVCKSGHWQSFFFFLVFDDSPPEQSVFRQREARKQAYTSYKNKKNTPVPIGRKGGKEKERRVPPSGFFCPESPKPEPEPDCLSRESAPLPPLPPTPPPLPSLLSDRPVPCSYIYIFIACCDWQNFLREKRRAVILIYIRILLFLCLG